MASDNREKHLPKWVIDLERKERQRARGREQRRMQAIWRENAKHGGFAPPIPDADHPMDEVF